MSSARSRTLRETVRDNGLGLVFGALLLLALLGQAFTGQAEINSQADTLGLAHVSFWEYVTSSNFTVDVAENWQSEYLQFLLYILLTVWLVQRGSPESKKVGASGRGSDREQKVGRYAEEDSPKWAKAGGWRTRIFSHSLVLVMGLVFLGSWLAQLVAGRSAYNSQQLSNLEDPVSLGGYLMAPDFWNRTLQNWQSELLAVGSMAVLSVYLRERGSPESKPVGAPHDETAVEG
ncbi:DUF6766 family protein [Segeticoccus rhizosphaerae]|jgi:hypothetical protein|uniref:DUF6766 family protein n=1 Tax=Segeticoccus rhizosphaerae TaxID=1104777 RepID=UPI0012649BEA|nr:DUF6766 family protein [Segeticoccus rhizosphaerae]